tara:strand:+ start:133 stop:798 length:666 start_codon:yes stop_codon:yes gene_type:complete
MNISENTLSVLKNFSDINQNILVKPGNKIQTISTMKNIFAVAEVSEKFESEFAIYDLPEFLRAVDLFQKPALKFNGGSNVTIASSDTKQSIKYFFADKSVIVAPTKAINMPDQYVSFTLKKSDFERLQKAITTMNLPDVAVSGDGKNIKLVATDKKNKSSNDYSAVIGETDKKFNAYFKAENLKIIGDDYDIEISQQKISHFVNRNKPVQYWIALEPDSEF